MKPLNSLPQRFPNVGQDGGKFTPDDVKWASCIRGPEYANVVREQIKKKIFSDRPINASSASHNTTVTGRLLNFRETQDIPEASQGAAKKAARALHNKNNILICIGSNTSSENGNRSPSAEGVRFALVLGMSARDSGSAVTYVADGCTASMIETLLECVPTGADAAADPTINALTPVTDIKIHVFDSKHAVGHLQSDTEAKEEAIEILNGTQADAVVTIELPDSGSGVKINKPIYEVVRAANAKDLLVVSVGKGGDKTVGFGSTASTLSVRGNLSNVTATAIGALLMKYRGKLERFIKPADFGKLAKKAFYAKQKATIRSEAISGKSFSRNLKRNELRQMYVDLNIEMLKLVTELAREHETLPYNFDKPTDIAIYDSSNGGFVASKVLKSTLEKLGYSTNFIIVVDHANAPYGQYVYEKQDQLHRLVTECLKYCQSQGAVVVVMACNTACIVPSAQREVGIPVVDLIHVTADAIVKDGGENPVLISTLATTLSEAYPDAVLKASGGKMNLRKTQRAVGSSSQGDQFENMISAPGLAELINLLGADVVVEAAKAYELEPMSETDRLIEKIIKKVPDNATSVWLTCTHYPVFQEKFKAALRAHRRSKELDSDIAVINPMTYQAAATVAQLSALEHKRDVTLGRNMSKGQDIVLSNASTEAQPFVSGACCVLYRAISVTFDPRSDDQDRDDSSAGKLASGSNERDAIIRHTHPSSAVA